MAVLASGEDTDNSDLQDLEKRKPHEPKRPLIDCRGRNRHRGKNVAKEYIDIF